MRRSLALLLPLLLLAAACGDGEDSGSAGGSDSGDEAVSGEVNVTGSSTVEPISTAVAELFQEENGDVTVNVDGPGTGDGFQQFCNGEADITDASRAIEQEETDACQQNGVEYIELKVGFDGISVLTNPANEDVSCLTFADLYALIGPESEGVDNWSGAQALATELGSSTELPDASLDITGPGEES